MSFSYNIIQDRPVDRIRFLLQDTCEDSAELTDEEILAVYSRTSEDDEQATREMSTAYNCAAALFRRYSRLVSVSADGSSLQYTQRAKQWKEVLETLTVEQPWVQLVYTARRTELLTDYTPMVLSEYIQ